MFNSIPLILRKFTVPFYRVRGLARIAESVRRHYSASTAEFVVANFDGHLKFRCRLNSHIESYVFWRSYYSIAQFRLLDRVLLPDMVFIDVGANVGEHTLFAARRLYEGQVVAFEPVAVLYERLTFNVASNHFGNVRTIMKGLADHPAQLPIYSAQGHFADGCINEGLPTLFQSDTRSLPIQTIDVVRLDDMVAHLGLAKVSVIKVDVEGAELVVLRGAERTITNYRPIVLIEVNQDTCRAAGYHASDLLDYLSRFGYRFELINEYGATTPLDLRSLRPYQDVICWPLPAL